MYEKTRNLRESHGLTQEQLAKILHIDQSTLSRYENGELNIPIQTLMELAKYYDVTLDYLLGFK